MPRHRLSHGRGGQVIPTNWAAQVSPVIESALATANCTITIGPAGGIPAWNTETGQTETPTATVVYDGPAAIMRASVTSDGERETADDPVTASTYQVQLASQALIEVGHVITVTASADVELTDRTLTVTGIEAGTRRFSRIVQAVLNT